MLAVTKQQRELTDLLDECSNNYYIHGYSSLSDTEFDLKLHELEKLERESGVKLSNSPTLRVGSDLLTHFDKVKHEQLMLTIDNTYNDEDLAKWIEKIVSEFPGATFQVSTKFDGVSCELKYVGGYLMQASTRGDKVVGDDITANVRTIKTVPLKLSGEHDDYEEITVYGEILLPKSRLAAINEERTAQGLAPFANTRNACSGSVKQLDSTICAKRGLIFRAWDIIAPVCQVMTTKMMYIKELGFYMDGTCCMPDMIDMYSTPERVIEAVRDYKNFLDEQHLDFDYDGVVVKVNEISIQESYGRTDHRAVEWAIARKWNEDRTVNAILNDVDFQVGRTGVITPVARIEPVFCDGVLVSNATLHNMDFINKMKLEKHSVIKLTRSGGVIPYVCGLDSYLENHEPITMPEHCPVCGGEVVKMAGSNGEGVIYKCVNPDCPAQLEGKILQFCSKDCMNIQSVGEAVVHDLCATRLVTDFTDLYKLKDKGINFIISTLGAGYGEKSVQKMLDEIEKSKEQPFEKLLASLSIPNVGKVVGRLLAYEFGSMHSLVTASVDRIAAIYGIGSVMAKDIYEYPRRHSDIIGFFMTNGFNVSVKESAIQGDDVLTGMILCFSGKSDKYKGDEIESVLESHGAKCTHSVSKKMTYLIIGDAPGQSKVDKAKSLGVEIITESAFFEKYNIK